MQRRLFLIAAAAFATVPGAPSRAPAQRRPEAEEDRIGRGWAMMNSDLVLIGPGTDPAGVSGLRDVAEALRRIAAVGTPFLASSPGSPTHEAESRLWRTARVDPAQGRGRWYREAAGGGAGAALEAAVVQNAYTLAERSAWLALRERRALRLLVEGDRRFSK